MLQPRNAVHPVLFFVNGIGDSVLNLPAVRAWALMFANRLTLVVDQGTQNFFFDGLPLRRRVALPVRVAERKRELDAEAAAGQIGPCDLFVGLTPWTSGSLAELVGRLRPKWTIGYFDYYQERVPLDFSKHTADLAFDTVHRLAPELTLERFAAPACLPAAHLKKAKELRALMPAGLRTLVVHADTKPEKMWPAGLFTEVLDAFLERHPEFLALLVGRSPQPLDGGAYSDRVIPCYGLPLAQSCALVAEADLFLGVDSCMLHVADFARKPAVGLFGPTKAHEFGFRLGPHVTLQAREQMQEIEPGHVLQALEAMLAEPRQRTVWDLAGRPEMPSAERSTASV